MIKYSNRARMNRLNAAKSTGPKTEAGKAIASHNAVKTALTGRTVLLPTDDVAQYQAHVAAVTARYQPQTDQERLHAQSIANIEWRLLRIPTIETGLLALGRKRFADAHQDEPADVRAILIEAEIQLAFEKKLANLALQENRLHRQHERETAKLQQLLTARRDQEANLINEAAHFYMHCQKNDYAFPSQELADFGFEFTKEQILRRIAQYKADGDRTHWRTIQARFRFRDLQNAENAE